jgi:aconitate hydratase
MTWNRNHVEHPPADETAAIAAFYRDLAFQVEDLWPEPAEVERTLSLASNPAFYGEIYGGDIAAQNPLWLTIPQASGEIYPWDAGSSYIKEPPFLDAELRHTVLTNISGARVLGILGNSVTTDHISPIGGIKGSSPAGLYLRNHGVAQLDFNNYGARRMNHEVMIRGAFSNLQLKNFMVPGVEGGVTIHQPDGAQLSIFDAAMRYRSEKVPLIVIAGALRAAARCCGHHDGDEGENED